MIPSFLQSIDMEVLLSFMIHNNYSDAKKKLPIMLTMVTWL